MRGHDIILLTETHQSPEKGLPRVEGYQWESVFRGSTRRSTSRGSGGVALLFRQGLHDRIRVVSRSTDATHMWIRLQLTEERAVYVALCYFAPKGSDYATHGGEEGTETATQQGRTAESPYSGLSDDILQFSSLGEVFLVGDFNGRTQSRQCEGFDFEEPEILHTLEEVATQRLSADTGPDATGYGHHLLELGSRHHLIIYNGMAQWPDSGALTCFPLAGAGKFGSTVDYILGSRQATQLVTSFTIPPLPLGADHTYLSLSLTSSHHTNAPHQPTPHTTIHFTHDLDHVYSHHLNEHISLLDPSATLSTLTSQFTHLLHTSALNSYPHHTSSGHITKGNMPQNQWYDEECRELYRSLQAQKARGEITHQEASRCIKTLTRRKRRAYEEEQYWDLYHLLMSRDAATAWRRIREPRPPTPIDDPQVWHTYAESLYHLPLQPPIIHPPDPRPTISTFFTAPMVEKAIRRLQHGRAADHTGIQGEHLIYASKTLAPFVAHLFNRAVVEGLPEEWTMHTIVPIHKSGDTLDPSNYRTIMIGHTLAKLYGAVLEAELSRHAEHEGLRTPGQAGFRRAFSTIDHIFTLRCLIDQAKVRKKKLYCCFVDFRKAFDTVPRERLFLRLQSLGVPSEMIWGIYALYEQVLGRVRCPGGFSDTIASTIGVKQGCPLSPTLFGLYIDEVADYVTQGGGAGVDLSGTQVHIMLYADDIVLISESQEGLQQHLLSLDAFCTQRGLTVNLGKTKVMIFHTSAPVRRHAVFTLAGGQVAVVDSYVYLGITFASPPGRFTMAQAAKDRLTRGYAALALLERQCHQAHFQEPRTKVWLFDTLVTPALMYASAIWAPGLPTSTWTQIERPQVIMLSRMIRSKSSVPHDIVRAEFATPPMLVEALFQTVCFVRRLRDMDPSRLCYRAFEATQQLAEAGETGTWYSQVLQWFKAHGLDIDCLPPFQYDLASPYIHLSHGERNRIIRQDLWQLYTRETWVTPSQPLPRKMQYYSDQFLSTTDTGFLRRPRYMDVYMSHSMRVAIGQIRVSSHQLEIETGRAAHIPREERQCRICREEVESEEHYICRCKAYTDIRERYPTLFAGSPTLRVVMDTQDPRRLGEFLLDIQRHREGILTTHSILGEARQTQLTDFFQRARPPSLTPPRGVTLQQAEEVRAMRRPRVRGYRTPRPHQREIVEIGARHRREMQTRLDQIRSNPTAVLQGLLTPYRPIDHIMGWAY